MRVIETLENLVSPTGLIGAMSSGQGSITNNTTGLRELYRGSKAALNMFMRSFAARQSETRRAFVLAGAWLGAHGPRRTGRAIHHCRKHSAGGGRSAGKAGETWPRVSGSFRSDRTVVKHAG